MERFIPREKLGKQARRRLDNQRRATWSISPITRRVESRKRYSRKTRERPEEGVAGFSLRREGALGTKRSRRLQSERFAGKMVSMKTPRADAVRGSGKGNGLCVWVDRSWGNGLPRRNGKNCW